MLYISCVEFQFCIHYIQLSFEKKWLPEISKGGQDSGKGGPMPPAPPLNETLQSTIKIVYSCVSVSILPPPPPAPHI